MELKPWYRVVTPRKEVRQGRSFDPSEFAIALEQVVSGVAPEDYRDPAQFFSRTCFTRALRDHTGKVLRRLAGETSNTASVLTLITQFGGGKTHTLTTLYHLANSGEKAVNYQGIAALLRDNDLAAVPQAKVAVFVGNSWDPQPGRETPWIDIAWQLAREEGVAALGPSARTKPPGTDAIARLFAVAGGSVLLLFDELLNFLNRHRDMADSFHAFIQNFTVAMTGTPRSAAVISLPRSQVEMTTWDMEWQEKITKVVRRVAKDLIVNDEAEIAEVIRRRLFEDIGTEKDRKPVVKAFADWWYERRAQLPPEWTAVDTSATEARSRELLHRRLESCYPFHPATLSVFQRKWQALPQYQQTRGTLAMLAQWISLVYKNDFIDARPEPLITLGSAPLDIPEFRSVVLGQLGESKLLSAIETDIAGVTAHARALDADTKGPLTDIHRRVGTVILFECSGGQTDKVAHLPELRLALGEPRLDTTSIDNAAAALASRAYYIRRVGSDGFKIHHQPTLKKVVNDRRASLDEEAEIRPAIKQQVQNEFERGRSIPVCYFPSDSSAVPDLPKLTLVVMEPGQEWGKDDGLRKRIADWTRRKNGTSRLYPGALVWCLKKPGKEMHDKVESWLAWRRVKRELDAGTLGGEFDRSELSDITVEVKQAEAEAKEEVWASYSFLALLDNDEPDGIKTIDFVSGHGGSETLSGRVIATLKSNAILNESPGAGYLDRRWPPALKESGAWPLMSLRQAFLSGAMERLLDVDAYLQTKIPEFVERGDFGLASGLRPDGGYERVWYKEKLSADEVAFDADVYLLNKNRAEEHKKGKGLRPDESLNLKLLQDLISERNQRPNINLDLLNPLKPDEPSRTAQISTVRVQGSVPPEVWNRLGTKLIPKLRSGTNLKVGIDFSVDVGSSAVQALTQDLRQVVDELGLSAGVKITTTTQTPGPRRTAPSDATQDVTCLVMLRRQEHKQISTASVSVRAPSRTQLLEERSESLGNSVVEGLRIKYRIEDKGYRLDGPAIQARGESENADVHVERLSGISALLISGPADLESLLKNNPDVLSVIRSDVEVLHIPTPDKEPPDLGDMPWHLDAVDARSAHGRGITGKGVWIGIADSGIDASHSEFAGREVSFAEFDKKGTLLDTAPHDSHPQGHGTHVAGIACGHKVGIAPGAALAVALVLPKGDGTISQVAKGINWLATLQRPDGQSGVDILNLSFCSTDAKGIDIYADFFKPAIDSAVDLGIEVVAAIGNTGDGHHGSPGNYANVLGIGAIDHKDAVWAQSCGGSVPQEGGVTKPDYFAPGVKVYSAVSGGGYACLNGTSMAAPVAAGVAALILQEKGPDVKLRDEIRSRARKISSGKKKGPRHKISF